MNLEVDRACKEENQLQGSSLKCDDFHDYKVIIIAGKKMLLLFFYWSKINLRNSVAIT